MDIFSIKCSEDLILEFAVRSRGKARVDDLMELFTSVSVKINKNPETIIFDIDKLAPNDPLLKITLREFVENEIDSAGSYNNVVSVKKSMVH